MSNDKKDPNGYDPQQELEWNSIRDALRGLRFGSVNIIVQDGVIVQIDRTEKKRIRKNANQTEVGSC